MAKMTPASGVLKEAAIEAAYGEDLQPFHELVDALAAPFEYRPEQRRLAAAPRPEEVVRQTFCGT